MTWDDVMVIMLRVMINDDLIGTECQYTDTRLKRILSVGAQYVIQEIKLDTIYTVDVLTPNITPDPTGLTPQDDTFINFVVLKAACIADQSLFRTKSLVAGLRARCGPAIMETKEHLKGFKDLIEIGPCKAYDTLKDEHNFTDVTTIQAVLSPFVSNAFDPRDSLSLGSSVPFHGHSGHRNHDHL